MTSRALRVLVPGLLMPAFMTHAGGWAVITVDELPDFAVAGKATTLSYMVRQHGEEPIEHLRGRVEAVSGRAKVSATVRPTATRGRYEASLALPRAGEWTITIRSGFGKSDITLLPLAAVDPGARLTRTASDGERGERLFVAKGCVTCHVQIPVGPKLDGKRFDTAYLAGFLANPKRVPPVRGQAEMPNLGLQPREIASLVAYLNGGRQVGMR
jgi:mono/diheme cytochrome c family protein